MPFEEEYFQKFVRFIRNSTQAGTYQFVFLKSLFYLAGHNNPKPNIDWGEDWIKEDGKSLKVDLNFIAVLYIKYYWDMLYKFRLKQAQPNNEYADDVNIHKNFKDESGEPKQPPKKIAELAADVPEYNTLREDVIYGNPSKHIRSSFNEVLFALDNKGFFKARNPSARSSPIPRNTCLEFDLEVPNFFQKYAYQSILDHAINYMLTKHLEKINKFIPQIAKKVLIDIPRGNLHGREKEEWCRLYESSETFPCFYCSTDFKVGKNLYSPPRYKDDGTPKKWDGPVKDHVIPFDYVLSDELYNYVPSCQSCNSTKSNRLPDKKILTKVIERNETLTPESRRDYSETEFGKLYRNCDESYNGDREMFHFQ